jgi:hypothetical protein
MKEGRRKVKGGRKRMKGRKVRKKGRAAQTIKEGKKEGR